MPLVKCPKCNAWIVVEAESLSQLMDCRYCNAVFPAIALADAEANEPSGIVSFFTENYNPEDSAERAAVIDAAKRRVAVPGTGLIVSGFIGMGLSAIIGAVMTLDRLNRNRVNVTAIFVQLGLCIAVGFGCFIIVAGGRSLRRLENRRLCATAATLGILAMAFCGLYAVITGFGFLFGTWAFVALSSREVKHAMRWKQREREERRSV